MPSQTSIGKERLKRLKDDALYQIKAVTLLSLLSVQVNNQYILYLLSILSLILYLTHFLMPIAPDLYLEITNPQYHHHYDCYYKEIIHQKDKLRPPFPIDIVITYAGDNDRSNHELKYTLRSIFAYLSWYNHIYIVTQIINGISKYPKFINQSFEQLSDHITIIDQSSLFINKKYAENNRNSLSFETVIHHIPNLSQRFIYFNDDFLIGRYVPYTYFFNENGTCIRWSKRIINAYKTRNKHGLTPTYSEWSMQSSIHPLTMGKRVSGYLDHHPRPLFKSYYFELERKYPEWFNFIRSHKIRYDSSLIKPDRVECESLHLHIMAQIISNQTMRDGLNVEIVDDLYSNDVAVHYWAFSKYNLMPQSLNKIINELLCLKPITFCINDNFDQDRNSKLYKEQTRIMQQFHDKYYKNIIPPWEKLGNDNKFGHHSNQIDVAYHNFNFCISRKSCYVW